jgi:sulfur-oxidizing protein SoxX
VSRRILLAKTFSLHRSLYGAIVASIIALGCAVPIQGSIGSDVSIAPLTSQPGDAARGRLVALGRDANCILCHGFPDASVRFYGDLAPPLHGVGSRLSVGQLRLRIVDSSQLNPATPMPPYHRVSGLTQVAEAYRGKPILTAQEVEDVIAYLVTLR